MRVFTLCVSWRTRSRGFFSRGPCTIAGSVVPRNSQDNLAFGRMLLTAVLTGSSGLGGLLAWQQSLVLGVALAIFCLVVPFVLLFARVGGVIKYGDDMPSGPLGQE